MKIGIIGAGSIGLLFAAYLSESNEVTIYTRTSMQAEEINEHGILLNTASERNFIHIHALPIIDWRGTEEFTIITVKQYQLSAVIEMFSQMTNVPENILFLQNGMGHLKLLSHLTASNIFVGTVEHGALRENGFTVNHNGKGATNVAVYKGNSDAIHQLFCAGSGDFPFFIKKNYREMLLDKLIVNAVINPLTALLGIRNGELVENQFYFHALKQLFTEISFVLKLTDPQKHFEQVISICKKTAQNRSSMLKDIESNRMTEVDAILGFIMEEAKSAGKAAPITESLFFVIKGKEQDGIEGSF
ncbi:2-dehydropantoate 2-reductase [Bacillus sp. BRMEA1]|uniref:2-dehydropantoate 2-reductase n=1 Tax=Neobacillus endophyticus TaxID=2738405 RepID=UPI0015643BE8|nr:2-dehydropantoate 2-reductase [Neobacillus endophyticus]NRD78773.1 2-dehydropantoate 2-reductase [Neobacillus endophyticus]